MNKVWSYGGGKQSAAIAALIIRGELPRPDAIVMSDTERESYVEGYRPVELRLGAQHTIVYVLNGINATEHLLRRIAFLLI